MTVIGLRARRGCGRPGVQTLCPKIGQSISRDREFSDRRRAARGGGPRGATQSLPVAWRARVNV
jgi:hypothetical protein